MIKPYFPTLQGINSNKEKHAKRQQQTKYK